MRKSYLLLFVLMLFIVSCANRVVPTGGKKDETSPKLLKETPENYSVYFRANQIELTFDEYVALSDVQNQLVISPIMDPKPVISVLKKSVILKLPKTLEANTTYTINFGKSIVDIKEGNVFENYQYVFATGEILDSLICKGRVLNASTLQTVKNITVSLYRDSGNVNSDSLIFKRKPQYFAHCNEAGDFLIGNIAAGVYRIFALDDKNSNYICDNFSEEAIAFYTEPLKIPIANDILLLSSLQDPNRLWINKVTKLNKVTALLEFNKSVSDVTINDLRTGKEWQGYKNWNSRKDSLFLFMPDTITDSLNIILSDGKLMNDTVQQFMGSLKEGKDKNLGTLRYSIVQSPGLMGPEGNLIYDFSRIVDSIGSGFELYCDSILQKDVNIIRDSLSYRRVLVQYKWKEGAAYKLTFFPGLFHDQYGLSNDTIITSFSVPTTETTAIVTVKVRGIKAGIPYILQLCTNKFEPVRQMNITSKGEYVFSYIPAGTYIFRLIEDLNQNGKWDVGILGKGIEPEPVYISAANFQLRSNWELDTELVAE